MMHPAQKATSILFCIKISFELQENPNIFPLSLPKRFINIVVFFRVDVKGLARGGISSLSVLSLSPKRLQSISSNFSKSDRE